MKLRQVEQEFKCSTMKGGGGLKVRARLCGWHSDDALAGDCVCNGAAMP